LSEQLRRGRNDFTALHEEYKQILLEGGPRHDELVLRGEAATVSRRAGNKHPFGKSAPSGEPLLALTDRRTVSSPPDIGILAVASDREVATNAWVACAADVPISGLLSPTEYREAALAVRKNFEVSSPHRLTTSWLLVYDSAC